MTGLERNAEAEAALDGAAVLAERVRSRKVPATEVVARTLAAIRQVNPCLGAFVHVDEEGAAAGAAEIDARIAAGDDPGPLAGVPLGVKEIQPVRGWPLTMASMAFADTIATSTATMVERARAAGAVPIGLTASPEMGRASFTASALHGVCRNPWNPERTPGGSSGGSAAAVAAGLVPLATGTDSAGSLRIPAAFTGLVGFKPTFGRVPRGPDYGGMAHTENYGALTRTVRDTALFLDCVMGVDEWDPGSPPRPEPGLIDTLGRLDLEGSAVLWSGDLGFTVCDGRVVDMASDAARDLVRAIGARPVDFPVRLGPDCGRTYQTFVALDVYQALRRLPEARLAEMDGTARQYVEAARKLDADALVDAQEGRHRIVATLAEVFREADFLVTPTTQTPAFAAEGPMPSEIAGRPVNHWGSISLTFPFNLSGHPAVSVPAGMVDGVPVGLQIVGRRHEDARVLAAAARLEAARPWPLAAPMA
ncbi:aspartyl-tRNA(Asn)/glutamyl-tRNA(Gln) amidotransferase subunit A [Spinactinospora alkalitolerans]|uniref:Aspartyl-tRNA(Asn)/glutamyl-tRNA(Gln) amidotransferase subunit A n=1 Tax=Spinactinospora alkalitolerans TaxID=687207 RepID=A0A852U1U8_9ACTN|nr:amidase [Spinactinospora alkalitolerans]NYE47960.1 aspartyl-tRNA(Asn)/glutamyl-tRNA(Gln) amidotransferase subunit A [Spinactinospora alkalitolerans]